MAVIITESLARAYDRAQGIYAQSKADLLNFKALLVGPAVPSDVVFNIARNPDIRIGQIQPIAQMPGMAAYAQSVGATNNPAYDAVAEFQAWKAALLAIRDHILATFPKDVNGFLLFMTFNADGTTSVRQFTVAQVATLNTLIDAALATLG